MDPFVAVLFGGLAVFILAIWLLGRAFPGSGLEQLGLKDARQITATRESLEAEDLGQLVAARNARRRARGEGEMSTDQVELQVARELGEQARRREQYVADHAARDAEGSGSSPSDDDDLADLLKATNARRRARGLPERTRRDAEEELGRAKEPRPDIDPPGAK